ncbi:hypothetical protein GK047_10855 [Paenibacillus sp. SYP-B3998]|uniref:YhcN/YlaJ family sporulation lipoprotein n=1 Tax=Paenibacillus sp. SYP-B3998 TaxID=2678564 RepID=A0A6G3ZWQ7_9BACL|nr:hypothetical protein [Paenibacillus sp. SYP-B3998]NEW06510.1 hypothetical protein [Paenibacillus sp. SYP-B3998]
MKQTIVKMVLITGLLCILTACSQMGQQNKAGASSSNSQAGSWDADSRNNENASIGAKSVKQSPQPTMPLLTIDNTKAHVNTDLSMNRELADQIIQAAHVGSTAVAVTNNNIYVAVDLGGIQAMGLGENEKILSKKNDPELEAGLFGSGAGAQMDWVSTKPLSSESANAIRHAITRVYPDVNIFISGNPHFVNRMLYYDNQQRKNKRMDIYLNEFNTIVQYAFPSYSTGQNHLMHQ